MPDKPPYIAELHDIGKIIYGSRANEILGGTFKTHPFRNSNIPLLTEFGISLLLPSWWAAWHWHRAKREADKKKWELPPDITPDGKVCFLLTMIADSLAASVTRLPEDSKSQGGKKKKNKKGETEEQKKSLLVDLLWRNIGREEGNEDWHIWRTEDDLKAKWLLPELQGKIKNYYISTENDLKAAFNFINTCQSPKEFLDNDNYEEKINRIPEDKTIPFNFTPLRIHLELVGKIFRVLRNYIEPNNNKDILKYDNHQISILSLQEAIADFWDESKPGNWFFRLVKCKVKFTQAFARAGDLNILQLRAKLINEIVKDAGSNPECQTYAVLFHTDDYLHLLLPKNNIKPLEEILSPLLKKGFYVEYEEQEAELNRLNRSNKWESKAVWPSNLEESFPPYICELCQLYPATEKKSKDQIIERLCPNCYEIRESYEKQSDKPMSIYADKWEGSAAWIKISLAEKLLEDCIKRLFNGRIDKEIKIDSNKSKEETDELETKKGGFKDAFNPLAAQMEFVREYKDFLLKFQNNLKQLKGNKWSLTERKNLLFPIEEYHELAIIKLDDPSDPSGQEILGKILDTFNSLLEEIFPDCRDDCPIRLSASIANVKYPYQEHWRFLTRPQEAGIVFHLQQPGVRELKLTGNQYRELKENLQGEKLSHVLHRLADIAEEAGEMTAMLEMLENRHKNSVIHQLMLSQDLKFQQVLDYFRLVGVTPLPLGIGQGEGDILGEEEVTNAGIP